MEPINIVQPILTPRNFPRLILFNSAIENEASGLETVPVPKSPNLAWNMPIRPPFFSLPKSQPQRSKVQPGLGTAVRAGLDLGVDMLRANLKDDVFQRASLVA